MRAAPIEVTEKEIKRGLKISGARAHCTKERFRAQPQRKGDTGNSVAAGSV